MKLLCSVLATFVAISVVTSVDKIFLFINSFPFSTYQGNLFRIVRRIRKPLKMWASLVEKTYREMSGWTRMTEIV